MLLPARNPSAALPLAASSSEEPNADEPSANSEEVLTPVAGSEEPRSEDPKLGTSGTTTSSPNPR